MVYEYEASKYCNNFSTMKQVRLMTTERQCWEIKNLAWALIKSCLKLCCCGLFEFHEFLQFLLCSNNFDLCFMSLAVKSICYIVRSRILNSPVPKHCSSTLLHPSELIVEVKCVSTIFIYLSLPSHISNLLSHFLFFSMPACFLSCNSIIFHCLSVSSVSLFQSIPHTAEWTFKNIIRSYHSPVKIFLCVLITLETKPILFVTVYKVLQDLSPAFLSIFIFTTLLLAYSIPDTLTFFLQPQGLCAYCAISLIIFPKNFVWFFSFHLWSLSSNINFCRAFPDHLRQISCYPSYNPNIFPFSQTFIII